MAQDDVELICDIGELIGIFEETQDLPSVLHRASRMIAAHMKSAVCSIYLYDPRQKTLTLAANTGLAEDAVGRVVLKEGEGLTGRAFTTKLRAINVGRASEHPHNKHIPGINEEDFESYLAAPITRGLVKIGVLVVQDPVPDYFRRRDEQALRAISSQIARIIENAKSIIEMHKKAGVAAVAPDAIIGGASDSDFEAGVSELIKGQAAAPGIAFGEVFLMDHDEYDVLISAADDEAPTHTVEDFRIAVHKTEQQLVKLQESVMENMSDVASQIFAVQILFLKDRMLLTPIEQAIENGEDPDRAITSVFNDHISSFAKLKHPIHQEKKQDLKDLGHRLLANLHGVDEEHADYTGKIIIARDLLPSDIVKLAAQNVEGLIVTQGTVVSHIAILSRSLSIPLVFAENRRLLHLAEDTPMILDALEGNIFIHPSEEVRQGFEEQRDARLALNEVAHQVADETYTADGTRIFLLANINLLNDVGIAQQFKAEGVGLYRSEIPFIVRSEFPSEEAQHRVYSRIVEQSDKETVFRTLDIGGDKVLPYHNTDEANPFMGLRAIRFSLRNRMIFSHQINALLRAGAKRIMFPFISSVDDFLHACAVVDECLLDLAQNGFENLERPQLGAMVELPAAVEIVEELAAEADFLSIGTNDLIQYMLAVDRTNENVREFYVPYHPAVLRALKKIADAGNNISSCENGEKPEGQKIDVCVCGDLARDPLMIPFLIGIGLRKLSVNPRSIPKVQRQLQQLNVAKATETAERMLAMGRVSQIRRFLAEQDLD